MDVCPSCGLGSGLWTGSSPFSLQSRSPWKTRSLMIIHKQKDQVSSGEVPACHWNKQIKYEFVSIGRGRKNSLTLPLSLLLQGNPAWGQEMFLACDLSSRGGEMCEGASGFPSCVGPCQRGSFLSHPIQSTKSWAPWLGQWEQKKAGRAANWTLGGC